MSSEADLNKATVRRFFDEVWNQRNEAAIDRYFAPDHVDHVVGGRTRFHALWQQFQQAFADLHFEVNDLIAESNRVVARLTVTGVHRGAFAGIHPTGRPIEIDGFVCFRMSGGRIVERWALLDEFRLLQQLSVLPTSQRRT